jgi:hypothetical protein
MCCYFNGFTGYRGFGMFYGLGGIFWTLVIVLGILLAVKLVKDMFFSGSGKKDIVSKIQ